MENMLKKMSIIHVGWTRYLAVICGIEYIQQVVHDGAKLV